MSVELVRARWYLTRWIRGFFIILPNIRLTVGVNLWKLNQAFITIRTHARAQLRRTSPDPYSIRSCPIVTPISTAKCHASVVDWSIKYQYVFDAYYIKGKLAAANFPWKLQMSTFETMATAHLFWCLYFLDEY